MKIEKVGVVGCGLMGHGIVQISAQAGMDVVVVETEERFLESGIGRIEKSLAKLASKAVEKGKATPEQAQERSEAARRRIRGSLDRGELADRDLVIEAIVEDLDAKVELFRELGGVARPEAIFASNTSSFPILEMARASGRPQRFVGLHFFNPVQLMRLVEVVRTDETDEDVFAAARAFGEAVGKTPVACKDSPGFIVNRLLVPYLVQALEMLERGDATKEDIDVAMQLGTGYPMGPITLTDYVGLDTTLFILDGWTKRYSDERDFRVPGVLREKVRDGKLGRKSGEGFYKWEGDKRS